MLNYKGRRNRKSKKKQNNNKKKRLQKISMCFIELIKLVFFNSNFLYCDYSKLFHCGEMCHFERPVCVLPMFQNFTIEAWEVINLQSI